MFSYFRQFERLSFIPRHIFFPSLWMSFPVQFFCQNYHIGERGMAGDPGAPGIPGKPGEAGVCWL